MKIFRNTCLLFLALFSISLSSGVAFPFKFSKSASSDRILDLVRQASTGDLLDAPTTANFVLRVNTNSDPECNSDFPLERAMGLAGIGFGTEEETAYIDAQFDFFKFALGWTKEEILSSRTDTLQYFKSEFGIDATDAVLDPSTAISTSNSSGLALFPVVFDFRLTKVSDNAKLVTCPNTTAVIGGWIAEGEDLTLTGPSTAGKPKQIPGEAGLFVIYIIFQPGTRFSTKIEWKGTSPVAGPANAFPLVGDMEIIDDFHEAASGHIDGVVIQESSGHSVERFIDDEQKLVDRHEVGEGVDSFVMRLLLMWPGRQSPPVDSIDPSPSA